MPRLKSTTSPLADYKLCPDGVTQVVFADEAGFMDVTVGSTPILRTATAPDSSANWFTVVATCEALRLDDVNTPTTVVADPFAVVTPSTCRSRSSTSRHA